MGGKRGKVEAYEVTAGREEGSKGLLEIWEMRAVACVCVQMLVIQF